MVVYEQASKELAAIAKYLDTVWTRVGKPDDCSTAAGLTVLKAIMHTWQKFYADEVSAWAHDRQIDLAHEKTLSELADGFGYNPITYPPALYQMLSVMLPKQNLKDKTFIKRLTHDFPILKSTNLTL